MGNLGPRNFFNVPTGNLQLTPHSGEWYTAGCEAIQRDVKRPKKWQEPQKEKYKFLHLVRNNNMHLAGG